VTERGPEAAQPGAAPSPTQAWSARMDGQPAPPGMEPGTGPTWGSGTPGDAAPPTAPIAAAGSSGWVGPGTGRRGRRRGAAARPGQPGSRRRRSAAVAWWALGALVLTAAAVVAILFGDGLAGDPSAAGDQQKTKATPTQSTDPALPTLGETTAPPTDTGLPPDTGVPTDTTAPPTATEASSDPLGLGVPMTPPACDGTWIIILNSAIDPATYAEDVTAALGIDPEAKYVLTEGQCASLRQATDDGNQIYAVWIGPYPDQQAACDVRNGIGGGAYVKRMDATTPPTQTYTC
jgi:hypothetical protein